MEVNDVSLLVWLPLNKNLNNYGIKHSTVTSSNATYNTNGKIGGCYSFNGSNSYLLGTQNSVTNDTEEWSVACWMKLNATTTGQCLFSCRSIGDQRGITLFYYGSTWLFDDGVRWQFTPSTTIAANTWYHICAVRKKGVGKFLYVNGVLDSSTTETGTPTYVCTTNFTIGGSQGSATSATYNFVNGYINDVRFYNHALSIAEIKELSKGLVVHYKLDTPFSITNLTRNSTYVVYNNFSSSGSTATLTDTGEMYDNCKIYRLTYTVDSSHVNHVQTALTSHGIYGFRQTFLANTKYCFWILWRPVSHPDTVCGGVASNIGGWTEIPTKKYNDEWNIVGQYRNGSVTSDKTDNIFTSFKTPSAAAGVPITIDFCCPHLVQGVDSILPEYDYIGTDPGVTDCSGYGYNAAKSGTLSMSSDTARYSLSTNFNQSGYIINPSFNLSTNAFTMNIWVKPRSISAQHFLFGTFSSWPNNGVGVFRNSGSNVYYCVIRAEGASTYSQKTITATLDSWNMLTLTYSGTVYTGYLNGEKVFEVTYGSNGAITHPNLMIGNSKYNNTPASENEEAYVNDFRLYATELSADDVKRLYNVGASATKQGKLLTYELNEVM